MISLSEAMADTVTTAVTAQAATEDMAISRTVDTAHLEVTVATVEVATAEVEADSAVVVEETEEGTRGMIFVVLDIDVKIQRVYFRRGKRPGDRSGGPASKRDNGAPDFSADVNMSSF